MFFILSKHVELYNQETKLERWSRRTVMVAADILRCAAQAASGALLLTDHGGLAALAALQSLAGVGTALFMPAAAGLVPSLVEQSQAQEANALLSLIGNINKVLSISVAGILVTTLGPGVALLVDAATFAISAISLTRLHLPEGIRQVTRTGIWRDVRDGARLILSMRWLVTLLTYGTLLQMFVIGPHMVAGPLLAEQSHGGPAGWAAIGVAQAAGSIAGGVLALRWKPRRPLAVSVSVGLLMAPYLIAFASGAPLWLICALAVPVGAQGVVSLTVQTAQIQQRVPDAARSRVAAWSQLGNLVAVPAGTVVAGPLAAQTGSGVLLAAAGWLIASTVVVLASRAVKAPVSTTVSV
jgi:predicted MFS family arabinose efflux permease